MLTEASAGVFCFTKATYTYQHLKKKLHCKKETLFSRVGGKMTKGEELCKFEMCECNELAYSQICYPWAVTWVLSETYSFL